MAYTAHAHIRIEVDCPDGEKRIVRTVTGEDVMADSVSIRGGNDSWVKGKVLNDQGQPAGITRNLLAHTDELPAEILAAAARALLN